MSPPDLLLDVLPIGAGATLVMDLWTLFRRRAFGIPSLDYALVGRWVGHLMHGRFRHVSIVAAPPVPGERTLGWIAHYAIGIAFAALPVVIAGTEWIGAPTLLPALAAGLASVAAPFFVMQPAFGFGIAASRRRARRIRASRAGAASSRICRTAWGSIWRRSPSRRWPVEHAASREPCRVGPAQAAVAETCDAPCLCHASIRRARFVPRQAFIVPVRT